MMILVFQNFLVICGKVEINRSGLVGKTVHECILNISFSI